MTDESPAVPEDRVTIGQALRLIWEADHYPILGNEDLPVALELDRITLAKAAKAIPSPDDPPEFAQWLATLLDRSADNEEKREDVMSALYDLFDPEDQHPPEKLG